MSQDDIIGIARFIDAQLERVYDSAGIPLGFRHLIGPDLAEEDVLILLVLLCVQGHISCKRCKGTGFRASWLSP